MRRLSRYIVFCHFQVRACCILLLLFGSWSAVEPEGGGGLGRKGDVRSPKSAGVQGSLHGVTMSTAFNGFDVYLHVGNIYIFFGDFFALGI